MLHNKTRLLRIEKWIRRFAWIYLGMLVLIILLLIPTWLGVFGNPDQVFWWIEAPNFWDKVFYILPGFKGILYSLVYYLFLQGVSKLIRYLLAMKEEILQRQQAG